MKNKFKTIYLPFEGYDFEIIVEYHVNVAGVFIVDTELTNRVSQNVNKQDFHHMLQVLRYRLIKREMNKEIKQVLIRKLNLEDECYKPETRMRNILIVASFIALIVLFII